MTSQAWFIRPLRGMLAAAIAVAPSVATAQTAADANATPPTVQGATAGQEAAPLAIDVALHGEGLLIGQLVDAAGKPSADTAVRLTLADGRQAEAKTNPDGGFAFKNVRGVARLESDKSAILVRSWTRDAAPPSAAPAVLLVEGGDMARGQSYMPVANGAVTRSKRLFANPLFVAGVIGTAVAIPVAIHNSDDDDPAS